MRPIDPRRGGAMIYVIMLMTMFAVLSTGFLYMSRYSLESALQNRDYMEARTTAKMIHQSYCQAVSGGSSGSMERIWEQFREDCLELVDLRGGEGIRRAAEQLEYSALGYGEGEDLTVKILLTARPGKGEASVNTRVVRHGYGFSMGADIRFDDTEGEELVIPIPEEVTSELPGGADGGGEEDPGGEASPGNTIADPDGEEDPGCLRFYTRGKGVYRYYEGTLTD